MGPVPTGAAFFDDVEQEEGEENEEDAGGEMRPVAKDGHGHGALDADAAAKVKATGPSKAVLGVLKPMVPHANLGRKTRVPDGALHDIELMGRGADKGLTDKVTKAFSMPQSFSARTLTIWNEAMTQSMTVAATTSTTVREVKELVSDLVNKQCHEMRVMSKHGKFYREEVDFNEVSSVVRIVGVKLFTPEGYRYRHPIAIIGGGYGGVSLAIQFLRSDFQDFAIFEKLGAFGGCWNNCANSTSTKLQTERGTYHPNFQIADAPSPARTPSWPSRDQVLETFEQEALGWGLDQKTLLNTKVREVARMQVVSGAGTAMYALRYGSSTTEADHAQDFVAGAVASFPGNLCFPVEHEFPGEDDFEGPVAYGSCNHCDYTQVEDNTVMIVGHGSFAAENALACIENGAEKVWIACRKRNLTAPKMLSWLLSHSERPATGAQCLRVMEVMYKLVGWDPWQAYGVQANEDRTQAHIQQASRFGVSDFYFLALYYKKVELLVDEIRRVGSDYIQMRRGKKIRCEVLIKALGLRGDFDFDKANGIEAMVGIWINGDVFRPCITNSSTVNGDYFSSLSHSPAIALHVALTDHFLFNPQDCMKLLPKLPVRTADANPCYCCPNAHMMNTTSVLFEKVEMLGLKFGHLDHMKASKQQHAHPLDTFLSECKEEWEAYIELLDGSKPPPYPFTEDMILGFLEEIKANKVDPKRVPGVAMGNFSAGDGADNDDEAAVEEEA
mmetsp:Transcript_85961/g.184261  ORF Transcript_85961/g.184261 Transcript_85961/m.184261 type:complete len:727 (+) Transcript_85961:98-2278(+)